MQCSILIFFSLIQSFTHAEEFISAQFPVTGASIDLVRLLVDQKSSFLISLNPLSDVKEVGDVLRLSVFNVWCVTYIQRCLLFKVENWVGGKNSTITLGHYEMTRSIQTILSEELQTTTINIKRKDVSLVYRTEYVWL
jgi:hypothetical protein